ncbi:unnamed protein product [Clonostachys chloroleuca]|uniref:Enoyl reductase (ER) domain-containing protein n=1 Tax=Clonostachys chloroleuca TaxID=1926264 RepID=A0AA35MCI1_9HYPO|nr:unnamed protein product [Clonostachys chloroleuca]
MSSLPKTYKAAVFTGPKAEVKLQDVELKRPGKGQVLVKVIACGVCFSDVAISRGEMGTDLFPRVPGHEIVGDVAAVGPDITSFKGGERVGGPWHGGHDRVCRQCQRSLYQTCDNKEINGVTRDGGWAEYVLLREEAVVRIPKDINPVDAAPLLCAGVTVFNGIRKMHVEQGALVAVQGLGGLGHLAVQYARHMGYEVAALSRGSDKESFARELGAHHYIDTKNDDASVQLKKLGGAELIVQTAPNPEVVSGLVKGLAPGGKLLCLAPVGDVPIDTASLVLNGLSVHGWPSGHALDSEEAIRFAKAHGIRCMVERYSFKDVKAAIDSLVAGKPRFRNVLVME